MILSFEGSKTKNNPRGGKGKINQPNKRLEVKPEIPTAAELLHPSAAVGGSMP